MSAIDLIPWEQKPEKELEPAEISWNNGKFLVPRLGYMTPDELTKIREIDPENETYRKTLDTTIRLRKALEANEYKDIPTAHQLFLMISTLHYEHKGVRSLGFEVDPLKEEIELNYRGILDDYIESIKQLESRIMTRSATVMMQRIRPAWNDDNTAELPEGIILSLYSLQQQEESAGRDEDAVEQRKAIEDDLKKLQAAMQSIVAARTGLTPTGNAVDSGQTRQNSAAKNSVVSRRNTSSKRSGVVTRTREKGFTAKS
jgi:hypothetical protein